MSGARNYLKIDGGKDRYRAGDVDIISGTWTNLQKPRRVPIVVHLHGANGSANGTWASVGESAIFRNLSRDHIVVTADTGGNGFLTDAHIDVLDSLVLWLYSWTGNISKIGLIGGSMGGGLALAYARKFPERIAYVAGMIPLVDTADAISRNVLGLAAAINAAYPGGAYDDVRDGPRSNPMRFATTLPNQDTLPIMLAMSDNDAVNTPTNINNFIALRPQTELVHLGNVGHSEASYVPAVGPVVAFARRNMVKPV